MLGLVTAGMAQGTITYDGPWRIPTSENIKTDGLSSDGADIAPGSTGGSAQFRTTTAYVDVKLQEESQIGLTGYKVSFSFLASTTRLADYSATIRVSYRLQGGTTKEASTYAVTVEPSTETIYLPSNATNVRFELASVNAAYVFLDAIQVSQEPELTGFSPSEGVPGTEVTINGRHLKETTAVYFGEIPATIISKDSAVVIATVPYGVGNSFIKVVTPYGDVTSATEFEVPAPVFATTIEFDPLSAGAGETVTLYGQYFTGVTGVLFNGVAADPTTIKFTEEKEDSEITVTVPNGATTGKITIVTPAGEDVSTNDFTVLGPQILAFDHDNDVETPAVEFSPAGGAVSTIVTIYGEYFTAVNEVLFNGVKATFTVVNDNQITATVPLGASTGPITVKSPAGQDVSEAPFDVPAPTIASFEPTSAGPNMQITITGTNLSGVSSVMFLGDPATAEDDREGTIVTPVTSDTELVVLVPADASTGKIQVISPGEDKVATSDQIFTFVPAPTIASVGTTEGGLTYSIVAKEVTITGTNFETATAVLLGSATIAPYNEINNPNGFVVNGDGTAITFNIPADATTGSVTVNTLGGQAVWEGPFEVIHAPIASIAPTKGPIGQKITITGQHLKYVSEVVFLGSDETGDDNKTITFTTPNESDTELVVTVPEGAVTGKLSVINPAAATETAVFEVIRTPVILTFAPNQGVAGTVVSITGYNFVNEGTVTVSFAGEEGLLVADNLNVTSDSTLTADVPAGAITGVITISNLQGTSVSNEEFDIIQKPTITSLAPIKGTEGSTVVITGTEFKGEGIVVTFLGTEEGNDETIATTIKVDSETQITATVPVGAVTGKLMVTNAAGASEPSEATYTVVTSPEIISFTETEGIVGDKVVITGWLLNEATGVAFNGTTAQLTYSETAGTIEATVPTGATTGPISLQVGEETVFTTTDVFTVIPAPTIIAFSPAEGGVAGTVVTITGTNFIDVTAVAFNGVAADMATVQINETFDVLTVTVPFAATTGKITITAAAGVAESEDVFVVPAPANITFTNNTATPTTSYAYQLVTVRGQFFTNASAVTFNGKPAAMVGAVTNEVDGEGVETGFQLITVKAPFDGGTGKVAVTTPAGTGTSIVDYTVLEPIITTISATQGYAGQTVVKITGELFTQYWDETLNDGQGGAAEKAPVVKFEGAQVTATTYTATEITVTVPNGARSGSLTVLSGSGESEPEQFTVLAPVISSVAPTAVYAGEEVVITGTNFINVTGLSYGGIAITGYTVNAENETGTGTITFVAPVVNWNSSDVLSVTSTSGTGTSDALIVYKPVITSFVQTGTTNDTRVYAGVNTVTIKGSRFDEYFNGTTVTRAIPTVTFAGSGSTRVAGTIVSATYSTTEEGEDVLEVAVPAGSIKGTIQVSSESGTGQASGDLTVIGAPTITSFSTYAGLVGTTFTITGTNFDDATEVRFLGIEGEADEKTAVYTVTSPTTISVTVPQDATIGKISVTTPFDGGTPVTSSQIFRVVKAPIIHDFVAKEGPAGYVVTITGENLIDVNGMINVFFKGHGGEIIPAPLGSQIDIRATVNTEDLTTARQITVTVPNNAITGVIRLTNDAGTITTAASTQTTVDEFTVTSPVIVRFEKENGSIISSSNQARLLERVIVKGYNLTNVGTIKIGTKDVTNFFEVDENTLEMVVPQTASRNFVTITALGKMETSDPEYLEIVRPIITVNPNTLSFKTQEGEDFDVKSYTVTAQHLAIGRDLRLSMTGDVTFQISTDPTSTAEGAWTRAMNITPDENGYFTGTISVRSTSTEIGTRLSGSIVNSSLEATASVTLESEIVPLPVELIAFDAVKQGSEVKLTWATASELDNDYFEVQMTEDLKGEFKAVGKVKSKVNTTSLRQDYGFSHKGNFNGTRYYRLKQVDLDGSFDYSKVVAVSSNGVNLAVGPRVYPNPINADSKLVYNADRAGKLNVRIVNMNGSAVQNLSYDIEEGENTILLNLNNNLPTGIYILLTEFNGKTEQVKLLKQ
ncbi:IPT/TIG domain-containing protein [Pontibacter virosus]|nr:IPT/TIG domain-containing protein [Pontibacter virosus]